MFGFLKSEKKPQTARKFQRRQAPEATAMVNGASFPVRDWSFSGLLMTTKNGGFAPGQIIYMQIHFKLGQRVLDTQQAGTVIRAEDGVTAVQFNEPVPGFLRCLQQVADYAAAATFKS